MFDQISSATNKVHEELLDSINEELTKIFAELGIDSADEILRRFKSFSCDVQGDTTTYYFNDGSIDGKPILKIVNSKEVEMKEENGNISASMTSYIQRL